VSPESLKSIRSDASAFNFPVLGLFTAQGVQAFAGAVHNDGEHNGNGNGNHLGGNLEGIGEESPSLMLRPSNRISFPR